ncbi:MAG: DUF167 family protein [Phycisphaerae bacterium]|nr:DUF167 family protein [Phycisphaerae bacterium]
MRGTDKLNIRDTPGGAIVAVKAVAGSSRDRVVGVLGDCLKIATSAPPQRGQANAAIAHTLAAALGVDPRTVTLAAGPARPRKEFLVTGLTADQVRARLAELS